MSNFDWKYYLIRNDDVREKGIFTEAEAYSDMLKTGKPSCLKLDSTAKNKEYIVTLLGYNNVKKDGSRHTNWFPWNRFLDVFTTVGYKVEWISVDKLKRTNEKRIFITWNEPTCLELYISGVVKPCDVVLQKLTSLGKGMSNENWTDNPHQWNTSWSWPIYKTVEFLYDLGLNVYGFGCKSSYEDFPEKARICNKLKSRIFWLPWGGTPFDFESIMNCKPVMNNFEHTVGFVGSKWGKIGRGNIDAWTKYIEPLEQSEEMYCVGGIGRKMVSDEEMVHILQKSKICPIIHAPSWQSERGVQDRFYTVFISGRFGISDNLGAVDLFGEYISDICTEDPEEYFSKTKYFIKNVDKQEKYIEYIQRLIKTKYNFYVSWFNILQKIVPIETKQFQPRIVFLKKKYSDKPFIM